MTPDRRRRRLLLWTLLALWTSTGALAGGAWWAWLLFAIAGIGMYAQIWRLVGGELSV